MDPQYIKPEVTQKCQEVQHRCNGIFCGCACHGPDRAQASAMLAQDEANMRAHAAQIAGSGEIEIKLPHLSRVALEPGDVLLLRYSDRLTQAQAQLIKMRLKQLFPGNEVAIISGHAEVSVLRPVPGETPA